MPVEPASRQILRNIGERLAAHDLGDDARKQLGSRGKTAAEQRQAGILRPDRKAQLTDDGTGVDPLLHAMDGDAEFLLAVADRPLMGVKAGIFRQQPRMKVQASPFERLQNVRRDDHRAVGVDQPCRQPACGILLREAGHIDDRRRRAGARPRQADCSRDF